jgi:hypothetical protein
MSWSKLAEDVKPGRFQDKNDTMRNAIPKKDNACREMANEVNLTTPLPLPIIVRPKAAELPGGN